MLKSVFSIFLFLYIMATSLASTRPQQSNKKLSQENFILILSSYGYENSWGTALIKQLQGEIETISPELITRVTYARLDVQQSFLGSRLQMQSSFTKGRLAPNIIRPRILVLVGEESWMLYRIMNLRGLWEQIPVVVCGAHSRIINDYSNFFQPTPSGYCSYIPISTSLKQLQVTGILKNDVSLQNLQLMHTIYPELQEIVYLTSGGFSDTFELQQLRASATQFYPNLQISVYNSNKIHPDSICKKLNALSPHHTAAIFNTVPPFLTALNIPVFSLQDQAFESNHILGGFYASTKQYALQTAELVKRLYQGEKAERLPFTYIQKEYNYLNQELSDLLNIPRNIKKSENIKLFNIPPPFLKRHQRLILLSLLGLLIVGLLYRYYIRNRLYNSQIRESLKRYKSLYSEHQLIFNHMPVSMMIFDENGDLLHHNSSPELQLIFPVLANPTESSSIPVNLFDHLSNTSLQTRIRNREMINQSIILYSASSKNPKEKNKHYFCFLVRYISSDTSDNKQILVVLINNQEIYEQRNIRRKLMQALDFGMSKVAIGVANYNLGGQRLYFSSNWIKNLDLETSPVKITQAYKNFSSEDRQSVLNFLQDKGVNRPLHYQKELPVIHRDGSQHWLRYQIGITGFHQETNSLVFTEISQNIDQFKALEKELYNAMLTAQRSEKLKNAFIANMGHEIRTPLNVIVGFSNLLCEANDLEIRQEMVRQIEENNEILLRLIHDIIDLSKIETGTMDFTLSSTDLTDLFNDMSLIAKLKTAQAHIEIKHEFPEEHYCIFTDKVRLKQVLTNFISNATKFTGQGSITLGYQLQNNELYGYVEDTGIGISQEKQNQIFDRFYRGTKNYKGFGLGLSISRSIIEGLNGQIGVESREGNGSRFWFRLPVEEVDIISQEHPQKTDDLISEALMKHTILVVEDNESNFLLLQFILQNRFHLIHAWNGEEAIELFRSHNPNLILMDIKMPKMDGYEATHEIRKYSTTIPIIATTAYALSKDEEKALFNRFDGYLAKPLQKQLLLDTINYWLVRHAS